MPRIGLLALKLWVTTNILISPLGNKYCMTLKRLPEFSISLWVLELNLWLNWLETRKCFSQELFLTNPKNFKLTLTPGQQLERSVRSIFGLSKKSEEKFISVRTRSEKSAGGSRKERSCRKINEATNLGNNSSQFFCFTSLSGTKLAIPRPE